MKRVWVCADEVDEPAEQRRPSWAADTQFDENFVGSVDGEKPVFT
jgi:hypothetical protein